MEEAEYCDRLALIDRGRIIALGTPVNLKTQYMAETVWELETASLNESLEILEASRQFSEVAPFGNTLHVIAPRGEDLTLSIPPLLAARSIPVIRLDRIEPSLEDVFVSLVERGKREKKELG